MKSVSSFENRKCQDNGTKFEQSFEFCLQFPKFQLRHSLPINFHLFTQIAAGVRVTQKGEAVEPPDSDRNGRATSRD